MKKYAVVVDVSPSEQLSENDNETKFMALLFGLHSRESFDQVGNLYPNVPDRLTLKKWKSSNKRYKNDFLEHARKLSNSNHVILGMNIASNKVIRVIGKLFWETHMGEIPLPSSFNNKNKPRVKMGRYNIDDYNVPIFEILIDDLLILGWYAEALVSCLANLIEINSEDVKLDVLIDHLPNEQGGDKFYKAHLLKTICHKATSGLLHIAGVPKKSDFLQRDLLVDNMAGLARELFNGVITTGNQYKEKISLFESIFRFNRVNF